MQALEEGRTEDEREVIDLRDDEAGHDDAAPPAAGRSAWQRIKAVRPSRLGWLGLVIGLLLLLGLFVAGPGRGMRSDIAQQRADVDVQRELITQQRDLITQQRDLVAQQLMVVQKQLEITNQQLAEARTTREISEDTRGIAERQLQLTEEAVRLQRELLAIAQQTLAEVKEVNRKTPNAAQPTSTATSIRP